MNLSDSWTAGQQPIDRTSASEAVFRSLRSAIESGELAVGTKLSSEATLGAQFGVSRSVVREALRSCAALGLTRTETGRGTFVIAAEPRQDLVLGSFSSTDLLEARPHIEAPAARLAAQRRTTGDLERLKTLMEAMRTEDDAGAWVELDATFHLAIAAASGNGVFIKVVGDIRDAMARQSETLNLVAGRREPSNREHELIVASIEARDPSAAERAMQEHLGAVRGAVDHLVRNGFQ
ncbi:FadR/GntR family transcriptional regulator [Arthrobacter sp.]|uniref:FadR/GntR family transcriptional regulator n=1 Tax=Arthrobacter sp. TaxID=1667 RepID=UPI003A9334FA